MRVIDDQGSLTASSWESFEGLGVMNVPRQADCARIRDALASKLGLYLRSEHVHTIWEAYSQGMCAGWMIVPDDPEDIVERLTT